MKSDLKILGIVALGILSLPYAAQPRGFGGAAGGGGGSYSGSRSYGGGSASGSYNANRSYGGGSASGSYNANRSYGGASASSSGNYQRSASGGYAGGSYNYDKDYSTARGGSVSVSGSGGWAAGPNGAAAGGTRDVTATTAGGKTYTGTASAGAAVGPDGNAVAGGSRYGVASGPNGTVAGGSRYGAAATENGVVAGGSRYGVAATENGVVAGGARYGAAATTFPTDAGLAHYTTATGVVGARSTYLWSNNYAVAQANAVRVGFNQYNAFTPAWTTAHPGAWAAAGFAAGAAWAPANWSNVSSWCAIPAAPIDYDYGNTIVYQGDSVYVNGSNPIPAADYAAGVAVLADQGRTANPPSDDQWQSMGVFALSHGDQPTSNDIFQLAVNQNGIIRGNYFDAQANTTTPVYGAVDKPSQRAAWSIGDQKDTVFEAGVFNLTKDQTAALVHHGTGKTDQMMLVRMHQPDQPQN